MKMCVFARIGAAAMIGTLALAYAPAAAVGGETLTGKMAMYRDLLGAPWTCTLGTAKYFAAYSALPANTLHGHLYSKDSSEDAYFGYDAKRKLYWTDSADSNGATESQTSVDGVSFVGTLNNGGATSKSTNVYTIGNVHKWTVRARGSSAGQPYDVLATCVRA
ncbi:MAG: hypothetical protein WCD38_01855 [Candidatus Tumulicola sp.]